MRKTREIKSKLNAIRNTLSDRKNIYSDSFDKEVIDIEQINSGKKNSLNDFENKKRKKIQNKNNIFNELLGIVETFVSVDDRYNSNDKYLIKKKIKRHAVDSIKITIGELKQIIQDNVKKEFFASEGICGSDTILSKKTMTLKPEEIDFLGLLTINPSSNTGQIFYEKNTTNKEDILNNLYNTFGGTSYTFKLDNTTNLFTINWNVPNQEFNMSDINKDGITKVNEFFNNYFSQIDFPNLTGITKSAMLLTIKGDGTEPTQFKNGINNLNKLLTRLFAICGSKTNKDNIKNQNVKNLFDENDENVEDYFDFDSNDDVDFEEEDSVMRNVLKFKDCNNFEIPVNKKFIEDFTFLITKKSLDEIVDETLEKTSNDAYEQSDGTISPNIFNINLLNNFTLNLPKALAINVVSPQIMLPIVTIFKMFKTNTSQVVNVKDTMKTMSKLFTNIIKDIFWKFIQEFWKRIKIELLNFVKFIIIEIKKGKYKRYINIVTAILDNLRTIGINQLNNCDNLFSLISQTIDKATSSKGSFIPGIPDLSSLILQRSDALPGLTKQKIVLDTIQYIETYNVPTDDIFGEKNDIIILLDGLIDSLLMNMDKYSYVKSSNKEVIIPSYPSPIVIPPGTMTIVGKIF